MLFNYHIRAVQGKGDSLQADTLAYNNFHLLFPSSTTVLFSVFVCEQSKGAYMGS